jgi:predicted acylesterase/phospholipase RssA
LKGILTITKASIKYAIETDETKKLPEEALRIAFLNETEGNPQASQQKGAENKDAKEPKSNAGKVVFYGFRSSTKLCNNTVAPARRIALLFDEEAAAAADKTKGWRLFQAAIRLAMKAGTFNDVFRAEWQEVQQRREKHGIPTADVEHPPENLVGLALSGGGLRSATFSLGLLQGLQKKNLLTAFDYLSTVSGGGYIGGWWSAWLAREPDEEKKQIETPPDNLQEETQPQTSPAIFPQEEKLEGQRVSDYLRSKDKLYEGSQYAGNDPIHHLRLFSNYLTPRKGLLSADTWQAFTVIVRNMLLTWVVLLPILFAFVVAGQFYFVLQRNSVNEFLSPFQSQIIEAKTKLEQVTKSFDERLKAEENNFSLKPDEREAKLAEIKGEKFAYTEEINATITGLQGRFSSALGKRAMQSGFLLLPIVAWLLLTTVYWMRVGVNPPAISQLANTVPGAIFWLLVIGVFCLNTSYKWEDWSIPYEYFRKGLYAIPGLLIFIIGLFWFFGSAWLWLKSLPYKPGKLNGSKATTLGGKFEKARLLWKDRLSKAWKDSSKGNLLLGNLLNGLLILIVTGLVTAALISLWQYGNQKDEMQYFWMATCGTGISIVIWYVCLPQDEDKWEWRKLIHGNKLVRTQANLMIGLIGIALVLALSGYGYEIANYVLRDAQESVPGYLAKAGGWIVVLTSIGGSIFTAVKSSPTGGEDKSGAGSAGFKTRLVFAITPILVLVSLAVMFAWLGRWLLIQYQSTPDPFIIKINKAIVVGVSLFLFLAVYELRKWRREEFRNLLGSLILLALVAGAVYLGFTKLWLTDNGNLELDGHGRTPYCLSLSIIGAVIGWRIGYRLFANLRTRISAMVVISLIYALFFNLVAVPEAASISPSAVELKKSFEQSAAVLAGLVCCGMVMIYEWRNWDRQTSRSLRLTAFIYLVLTSFLFFAFFATSNHTSIRMAYLTLALLFISLSWAVAIGWMTDPNTLSLHTFYKSRLVRAYLSASNLNRKNLEISEAAGGDDVLLGELKNCQRGAPYHLINTTLNLVGGRDLATAQRHSDYFVFSKLFSGSSRTGYRRNLPEQYMQGEMSLGTAVAVSGAAVSPNMGAKTQTSAVAMLLTLLNVRLGYWASTPNRNLWRSAQAGLWPIYMLKEFLSQTNDLSGYCYLTDGGHFDNTGLYSLVERGCRFIILSDNGADTKPCFEDLGDAIRRCRIDFQAEIHLDMSPFFKQKDEISEDSLAKAHYVVGTIEYSERHLKQIGWKEEDAKILEKRKGVLIVIKPSLVKEDSVDLRQYARQNGDFPQQSTGDFWYNEAQFESYRQIGKLCAENVLDELGITQAFAEGKKFDLKKIEQAFKGRYKPGNEEKIDIL